MRDFSSVGYVWVVLNLDYPMVHFVQGPLPSGCASRQCLSGFVRPRRAAPGAGNDARSANDTNGDRLLFEGVVVVAAALAFITLNDTLVAPARTGVGMHFAFHLCRGL